MVFVSAQSPSKPYPARTSALGNTRKRVVEEDESEEEDEEEQEDEEDDEEEEKEQDSEEESEEEILPRKSKMAAATGSRGKAVEKATPAKRGKVTEVTNMHTHTCRYTCIVTHTCTYTCIVTHTHVFKVHK